MFGGLWLWLGLVADSASLARPSSYRSVWLVSFAFWLATDYFVTLPHWAGYFGWIAMSAYMAVYFPFFFAASRALVHGWRIPFVLAAPIAWVAMEWLRAHVITGFGMAMLPHAMYRVPWLIQTADIMGGYGTSFLLVFFVAALHSAWRESGRRRIAYASGAALAIGLTLAYGALRLNESPVPTSASTPIALIQGSRDVRFELSPEDARREWMAQFREYRDLTAQARKRWPDLKLILWPESAFPQLDAIALPGEQRLTSDERFQLAEWRRSAEYCWRVGIGMAPMQGDAPSQPTWDTAVPLLTGAQTTDVAGGQSFNSAIMFEPDGTVGFRYHKMHLVMFGEYVPLGDWYPQVYRWMPIPDGLSPGTDPRVFQVDGLRFCPSICFESTVGHLIRRHVLELQAAGKEPDVLINLTNDGWFYGSNCLDLHLACNVFRAVEMRKPMLVAANTGFSAQIDGSGRLLQCGPRRQTAILKASVQRDGRVSPYLKLGDWPAIGMTLVAVAALVAGLISRRVRIPDRPKVAA